MDLIKELKCARANFDSAKEEYRKAQKEILTELLATCNLLDVDCERRGKLGQLKVSPFDYDYEIRFYPYTEQGTLSQKTDDFGIRIDTCNCIDDFVYKLANCNDIRAIHDTPFDVFKKEKDKDLEQTYENNDFER